MWGIHVTGALGDFGLLTPSKHRGRSVGCHSLLRQRYRSLFFVPSRVRYACRYRGGLSAFSTNIAKNNGFFDSKQFELKQFEGAIFVIRWRERAFPIFKKEKRGIQLSTYFFMYSRIPKALPSGSSAKAHQPNPGISIFSTTILPPKPMIFLLYSSTDSTEM